MCGHVNFAPVCDWIKRLMGIPYMVVTYGIDVWDIHSRRQLRALERASLVTALSEYTRYRIAGQVELGDRLVVQPHPVRDLFAPAPKPDRLAGRFCLRDKKVVLTVSRLAKSERYKGYDRVIAALGAVASRVPNVAYLIVGDGDDLPRARRHAEECGVADRVVFAGAVPNEQLPAYYNLSDIFVMPSKNEGLGIVYLEALACGKPVIAGATGGARDALRNGELGQLVNPDNTPAIADAIADTLTGRVAPQLVDPEWLRAKVQQHFGFDRYCEAMESLVRSRAVETAGAVAQPETW